MKKVISLVLSVLMVLSLFSCLGVTTFAYDDEAVLEEISFEPVSNLALYEYANGYWHTYYDYDEQEVVSEFEYDLSYFLWEEGNVITLWYSDGTYVDYTCSDDMWYYDENGEMLDDEFLYFYTEEDFALGNNTLIVEYEGVSCEVLVEILESPVASAQFILEEPLSFKQNVDGDLYIAEDGPYYGDPIFIYGLNDVFAEGTRFVVKFNDGIELVYEYSEFYDEEDDYYYYEFVDQFGGCLDWDNLSYVNYQEYDPWIETGSYSFEFYYMGCPFEIEAEIIENDIEAVEYTPAKDYYLTANFDGEYVGCSCDECAENDDIFFYYDLFRSGFPCDGEMVTVYYKDGTVTDYTYSVEDDWFYDIDGKELPYDAKIIDYQESDHWEIGNNNAYFWYAGYTAAIPFEVVDNPVVDFSVKLSSSLLYEGVHGDYTYDENGEEFFYYGINDNLYRGGTELTFEFADGSERVYCYDEYEGLFYCEATDAYLNDWIQAFDDQYDTPWDYGKHDVTICCLGYECTVTVTVAENPIASIDFIPAEVITFQAFEGGWWDWYCDVDGEEYECYFYDTSELTPYTEGNKIVVTYKRGSTDTFVYDEDVGNFVSSRGYQLTTASEVIYKDYQMYYAWSEEEAYNYLIVEFMGCEDYVWVNIENGLPGAPVITDAYNGVGKITIEWDYLPGAAEYRVYRRGAGQTSWTYLGTTDENYFVDESSAIKADGYYRYTVRSVNSHGFGGFDPNGVVIRYIAPVTGVKATNTADGIKITWNSYPGATCDVFRLTAGSSEWEYLTQAPGSGYYVVDPSAKSGTYYRYAVIASKGLYYSDVDMAQTALLKCVATPKLTGISNATNGIYIKWNAITGATGYRVYRRGAGQSTWTYLGTTTNCYYTDTGVKNASGNYYRYTVRAVSYNVFSGFDANGLYIKRLANPALTSAKSAKAGITVKWNGVTGAQGYYVYRKTANSSWQYMGYVTGTSYLDKSASKGVTYTYTVRARSGNTTSYFNSGISCKDLY